MASPEILVTIGESQFGFTGGLRQLTHVRGFNLATSYCVVELEHPQQEALFEWATNSKFTVKYGVGEEHSDIHTFRVLGIQNIVETSATKVRIVGVEPGFVLLSATPKARSYSSSKISSVVSRIAAGVGLTADVLPTKGTSNYVQPRLTDLQFIVNLLQPIAIGGNGEVPFLFTIDNDVVFFRPPTIINQPQNEYVVDPSAAGFVKKFVINHQGGITDFLSGNTYQSFGYDPVTKGLLSFSDSMETVTTANTSKFVYESDYLRLKTLPYSSRWMLEAHTKNVLARSKFVIDTKAVVDGDLALLPDQINRFVLPFHSGEKAEYSGDYYTFGVVHKIVYDLFLTHLHLISNSVLKNLYQP